MEKTPTEEITKDVEGQALREQAEAEQKAMDEKVDKHFSAMKESNMDILVEEEEEEEGETVSLSFDEAGGLYLNPQGTSGEEALTTLGHFEQTVTRKLIEERIQNIQRHRYKVRKTIGEINTGSIKTEEAQETASQVLKEEESALFKILSQETINIEQVEDMQLRTAIKKDIERFVIEMFDVVSVLGSERI